MTPEQWRKISPILESALELDPAARPAFLDGACPDVEVRREVESLIASPGLRSSFLESPAVAQAVSIESTASVSVWTAGMKLGPYQIQSLLGAGGMGEVYRARDTRLDRIVAIKVLPRHLSSDPARKQRFEREARAIATLQHANICTLFDVGNQDGTDYLVMEYLEGETLSARLSKGPLPLEHTLRYGIEIADALETAHRHGIVHRDLKPGNIMVTIHECKVLDFGLAKLADEKTSFEAATVTRPETLTSPGLAMGTVAYMSPEQARGEPLDSRTDVFSLGAVLSEMATGKMAFAGKTSAVIFKAILDQTPAAPTQLNTQLPERMDEILGKALEKDRELRYQSAADLRADLNRLKRDSESARLRLSESGRVISERKGSRRRRAVAAVWSLSVVVVISLAGLAYFGIAHPYSFPSPRIAGYTQITRDGHAGDVVGTDGSRLYLGNGSPIGQVAASGGEIEPVPSISLPKPALNDVSPDGSTFLVQSYEAGNPPMAPLYSVRIPGGAHRYLTNAIAGFWSPDGKSVLFTTRDADLYVMGSDGTNVHKVAHAEYPSAWLSWSPNGEIIRFSERNSLWEMSSNGSNLHPLLRGWRPSDWKVCGNWSSHGEYFFFRAGPESQIWALDERRGLFRTPSGLPIQMTSGPIRWGNPVPSKDGTKIFATGSIPRGELVRFEAKSNQIQPFMGGVSADLVSFSKNGQTVAYVSFPDNILWKVNRDGSERVQLTDPPLSPEWISLSPDGNQVLFMATPESRSEAWIVSVQGGSPRRLFPEDGGQQTDPNWSPDGSKIVFATNRQDKPDRHSSIRILDVATHQVTNVPGSDGLFSPHWSPDGQSIAASTLDLSSLHIFDRNTQRWSTIYKGLFAYANWSADSRFLYFFRYADDPAILRIPVKGGEAKLVVSLKDFKDTGTLGIWFGLDPTDAPLLLRDVGTSDVYALTLETK